MHAIYVNVMYVHTSTLSDNAFRTSSVNSCDNVYHKLNYLIDMRYKNDTDICKNAFAYNFRFLLYFLEDGNGIY